MKRYPIYTILFISCISSLVLNAQPSWQSLGSIDAIYEENNKPYLIYIYTDWCKVCKVQSQGIFSDTAVSGLMDRNFNSYRLNAESSESFKLLGREYEGAKNSSYHEFATVSIEPDKEIAFPTLLIFSRKMNLIYRKNGLVSKDELNEIIQELK